MVQRGTPAGRERCSLDYSPAVTILRRIAQAFGRANRDLGSAEGTDEGTRGFSPAVRHVEAAERQEFPPEEFASEEQEETE